MSCKVEYIRASLPTNKGVQRRVVLVVNCSLFLKLSFFCFIVAICDLVQDSDLVQDVEAFDFLKYE